MRLFRRAGTARIGRSRAKYLMISGNVVGARQGMRALISQRAEDDLARTYGRIAINNPEAAERFRSEAEKALKLLGEHPEHRPRPGWQTCYMRLRII